MKMLLRTSMLLTALLVSVSLSGQSMTPAAEQAPKGKRKAVVKNKGVVTATPMAGTAPAEASKTPSSTTTPAAAGDGAVEVGLSSPGTAEQPAPEQLTTISFAETSYDFGKIQEGEVVKHKFKFTNTGAHDLILENVKPSCGCTALDWPKDPIPPGKSGEIEAQFNSTGKAGAQMKYITITLNSAERLERITFSGEVVPRGTPAGN